MTNSSTRRIELAVPPKGARYSWPTYRLTEEHLLAAFKAIHGSPMTRREKVHAKWFAEYLMRARSSARAADWQAAERAKEARRKKRSR